MAKLFANDTIAPSYRDQLRKEHSGSKWGSTGGRYSGDLVAGLLRRRPYIKTVLDFGAGKGSLEQYIRDIGLEVEWTNYDPGMPEYDTLPEGQFDLVVTTDVLEHIEPDKIDDVLKTLGDKTGKVLLNDIACYPTGKVFSEGPYEGQDLHLIIEEPSWWLKKSEETGLQLFEYSHVEKLSKGKLKPRCILIHERV